MHYKIILFVNFFFNYGINALPIISLDNVASNENNVLLMKRQLTEEDIVPNQEYFDEIGYLAMRSLYAVTLLLLQASLLGSLYVMYRTLSKRPAFFKDGDNSVVHKFPFYMAYFDAKIAVFLTINLIYPTIHVDNWPSIMCSLLSGAYFFSVISDILFAGAFAIIFWLKACYKIEFSLGAYDYKLFVVTTIISLVMTIAGGRSFGSDEFWCYAPDQLAIVPKILLIMCFIGLVTSGFCYCNIFARVNKVKKSMLTNKNYDGEMDLADKLFINDSKKMLGYLLTYNAKWVPLTAYVIADLINYEKIHVFFPTMMLFVLFSGILNMAQYINNERKSTNIDSNNNNNDTNQSAVGTM